MKGSRLLRQLMLKHFIGMEDLKGHTRYKEVVASRVAVVMDLHAAGLTKSEIARLVNRDHSSIVYWTRPGRRERMLPLMRERTNEWKRQRRERQAA